MNMTARFAVALIAATVLGGQIQAQTPAPVPAGTDNPQTTVPSGPGDEIPPVYSEAIAPTDDSRERWWVGADYLFGFIGGTTLPPLVTTSPTGTAQTAAGVLGQKNTHLLFGDNHVNTDLRSGFNFNLGCWFDAARTIGIDSGFFMLGNQTTSFAGNSQAFPILARPFRDANTGQQQSQLIAFPGLTTNGSLAVSDRSSNFYSAHVDFKEIFLASANYRFESILGYRYLRLDDNLGIQQNMLIPGGGGTVPGTDIQVNDSFGAQNQFNGVDMGLRAEFFGQRWSLGLQGKVAVGGIHRSIGIAGNTLTTVPGQTPFNAPGGLLALSSNSGTHNSDDFLAVPELSANFGWNLTNNLRLRVGYAVLFLDNIARAGDQVNLNVNPNLFPPPLAGGPNSPSFNLIKSDLWVQTINLGLEFRY